jgi:orotidine-5'-phosphate decarboxylase
MKKDTRHSNSNSGRSSVDNTENELTFYEKYSAAAQKAESKVCVGLDPDLEKLPPHLTKDIAGMTQFLTDIVDATSDLACAYKPNFAFFGALGAEGFSALKTLIEHIPDHIPTILDFKAGDIGNTAEKYAEMAYDVLGADAVTVNPYMGFDAVEPFLRGQEKCVFLLCLTSNPGSSDFQRIRTDGGRLFEVVAKTASGWSDKGACGLVVGATHPEDLPRVRVLAPELPLLIPGVGSQGGDPSCIVDQAASSDGLGLLINASRSVLYASSDEDYAQAARQAVEDLRRSIEG